MFKDTNLSGENANKVFLILIIALGSYLRIRQFLILNLPNTYEALLKVFPDEYTYYTATMYIHKHGLWNYLTDEISLRIAPFNPTYLSIFSVFDSPIEIARYVNLSFSILTLVIVYFLGKVLFSKEIGLIATFFVSVYKPIILFSGSILTEPTFFFLFLAAILLLVFAIKSGNLKTFILPGIVLGLATLNRPVAQLLPFFTLFCLIIAKRFIRVDSSFFRRYLIFLLGFVVIISPVLIKNKLLFDRSALANGSGVVLWLGSREDTEGDEPPWRGQKYDNEKITYPETDHLSTYSEQKLMEAGLTNIKSHPFKYFYWYVKKFGRLLVGNKHFWYFPSQSILGHFEQFGLKATVSLSLQIFYQAIIVSLGFFGLFTLIRSKKEAFILASFVIYWILIHSFFLVNPRYGYPLFFLFAIFAAFYLVKNKSATTKLVVPSTISFFISLFVLMGF